MDPKGHECQRASLMDDGSLILRSGMTAQGYFTEKDKWVPSKDLIGLDLDGKPIQITPSTLGVATQMEEQVELESLMDLCVDSIYLLEPIDLAEKTESFLESGGVFRFSFNYRADYHAETGYLLKNKEGYFALIGNPSGSEWMELKQITTETFEDDLSGEEYIDFDMF